MGRQFKQEPRGFVRSMGVLQQTGVCSSPLPASLSTRPGQHLPRYLPGIHSPHLPGTIGSRCSTLCGEKKGDRRRGGGFGGIGKERRRKTREASVRSLSGAKMEDYYEAQNGGGFFLKKKTTP